MDLSKYKTWDELVAAYNAASYNNGEDYKQAANMRYLDGIGNVQGGMQTFGSAEEGNQRDILQSLIMNTDREGYNRALFRNADGTIGQQDFKQTNGIPTGMLLPLAMAAGGMFLPELFGAAGAAGGAEAGSLAEAMATYAPEFGASVEAAGMGGATSGGLGLASGIPELAPLAPGEAVPAAQSMTITGAAPAAASVTPAQVAAAGGTAGAATAAANSGGDYSNEGRNYQQGSTNTSPINATTGANAAPTVSLAGTPLAGKTVADIIKAAASSGGGSGGSTGGGMGSVLGPMLGLGLDVVGTNKIANDIKGAANTSAGNINNLAQSLADKGKFTPYNVTSSIGTVSSHNGVTTQELSPQQQAIQNAAFGQIPNLLSPYQNQNVTDISGQAYDKSKEMLNKQVNPLYAANEQAGLAGSNNMLKQLGLFDPNANAKTEYDALQQLYAPTREKDNLAMENRLLSQGRLGLSVGGGAPAELQALKDAQRQQDLQASINSRQLAFDRQGQMITQAGNLQGVGINAGAAGQTQQANNISMANTLFGMGMSGDKFMQDMNVSRTNQAATMQNIGMKPTEQMNTQVTQGLQQGQAAANAAAQNNTILANLGLNAERTRYAGAVDGLGIQAKLLGDMSKGAQGFLNGSGGAAGQAVNSIIKYLTSSGGMTPEQAQKYVTENWKDIVPEGTPSFAAEGDPLDGVFSDYDWF
jgi:hypothetical protein